jgi:hypothetical protein
VSSAPALPSFSSAPPPGAGPSHRVLAAAFALFFVSYAYFAQGGGPNQYSRLGLVLDLAEHGRVDIDPYADWTFDKAVKDGHFYCDKAPGLSLLAAPVYAALRPLVEAATTPDSSARRDLALYLVTLLTVSLPVAAAMTTFFRRAWREAGPRTGFWVAVALGLGSPLAVYASLFYAHALAAALCWLAFDVLAGDRGVDTPRSPYRAASAGLLGGLAVLCEFPTALLVAGLFVYLVARSRSWRAAAAFVAGGLPSAAALVIYNTAAFGRPLASGYQYHAVEGFRVAMSQGVMGVTGPTAESVFGVLVGTHRGLLWFWPFSPLAAWGAAARLLRRPRPAAGVVAAALVVAYLLFGCSYYFWSGGSSYGPRHVIPCLPFAAYLAAVGAGPWLRRLAPAAALLSVAAALPAVATQPEFPDRRPDAPERMAERDQPLWRLAWPRFLRGEMSGKYTAADGNTHWDPSPTRQDPHYYDSVNLGQLLGLDGLASLLPLAAVWAALGGYAWWAARPRRP